MRRPADGWRPWPLLAPWLLGLLACAQQAEPPIVRSLERSGEVAFACRVPDAGFVDLSRCDIETARNDPAAPRPVALLTQVARGQVAAVDLAAGRVIDADGRIPGYSFPTVIEAPSGLVVPPRDPKALYVASAVAPRIEAHPMDRLVPGEGVHERLDVAELPGAAAALELDPGGRLLLAPLPDVGAVALLGLQEDGRFGAVHLLELPAAEALPPPVDLAALDAPPATAAPAAFERLCLPDGVRLRPPRPLPPPAVTDFGKAEPVAMSFEPVEAGGRPAADQPLAAWVADRGSGALHRIVWTGGAPEAASVQASVRVGAPLVALAVTPRVPALGPDGRCEPARYVYAVDGRDGSLLAVDVSDPASPSFGAVLPIGPPEEPMRRRFGEALVTSLRVVAPGYPLAGDPCGELPWCDPAGELGDVAPDRLRGVFLVAGLSDGTVRVLDVLDLDAPCRGRAGVQGPACGDPEGEPEVYVRRHAPRIGVRRIGGPSLAGAPIALVERVRGRVLPDGTVESDAPLRLRPLPDGCPAGSRRLYPLEDEGDPVLCASADPWSVRPQRWVARWEGALPGSRGALGRLQDGGRFVVQDPSFDFCAAGVLGREDVPGDPAQAEAGYGGDQLRVVGEPSAAALEESPDCARFAGEDAASLRFAVVRASRGELLLGEALGDGSLEDLARCFPEGAPFVVGATQAFVVTGGRHRPLHRVRADEDGRCAVDASLPATRQLRARLGRPFDNGQVAFVLEAGGGGALAPGQAAELYFDVLDAAAQLGVDLCSPDERTCSSSLPTSLRPGFGWLFVADGGDRGLAGIPLSPFRLEQIYF